MVWELSSQCYLYQHLAILIGLFILVWFKILTSRLISFCTYLLFKSELFSFQIFENSPYIFLLLISNFILCYQRIYFAYFKFFYIHWDLFYGLGYCLSWNMSHVHLKRICPLLFGVEYSITINNLKLTVHVQNLNYWAENFSVIDDSVSPYVLAQMFFFFEVMTLIFWVEIF